MTLNLDEMDKVLREATALVAMFYKAEKDAKVQEYITKEKAITLMRELGQVGEQIRMLRDMFTPPSPEED